MLHSLILTPLLQNTKRKKERKKQTNKQTLYSRNMTDVIHNKLRQWMEKVTVRFFRKFHGVP
jgi:hypothetical protein